MAVTIRRDTPRAARCQTASFHSAQSGASGCTPSSVGRRRGQPYVTLRRCHRAEDRPTLVTFLPSSASRRLPISGRHQPSPTRATVVKSMWVTDVSVIKVVRGACWVGSCTMKKYASIRYGFRPQSYWEDADPLSAILRNVTGENRRRMITDYWNAGRLEELDGAFLKDEPDEESKLRLGRIHPSSWAVNICRIIWSARSRSPVSACSPLRVMLSVFVLALRQREFATE